MGSILDNHFNDDLEKVSSQDLDPEFSDLLNEHFWELITDGPEDLEVEYIIVKDEK